MTQDQWLALALKIGVVAGFASILWWVIVYTRIAPWWKDPVGKTLVAKSLLLAGLLLISGLSLFFKFNRTTSHIAGWIDAVLIAAVSPVMWWRTVVWIRAGKKDKR